MRGVNKAILIGNLGAEPELRFTKNNVAVCTLSLATNDRVKNAQGEWDDKTTWHRVILFKQTAENAAEYLHKGSAVYVEGKIENRQWQDNEGVTRYITEIIGNNIQYLDGKSNATEQGSNRNAVEKKVSQQAPKLDEIEASFDDDIPF